MRNVSKFLAVAAVAVLAGFVTHDAEADSPHFISTTVACADATTTLEGSFTAAGLDNKRTAVTLSATALVTCQNPAGSMPPGQQTETVKQEVTVTPTNGSASGNNFLTPTCKGHAQQVLTVTYTNITYTVDGDTVDDFGTITCPPSP